MRCVVHLHLAISLNMILMINNHTSGALLLSSADFRVRNLQSIWGRIRRRRSAVKPRAPLCDAEANSRPWATPPGHHFRIGGTSGPSWQSECLSVPQRAPRCHQAWERCTQRVSSRAAPPTLRRRCNGYSHEKKRKASRMSEYCFTSLAVQSWKYRNIKKLEAGTMPYSYL